MTRDGEILGLPFSGEVGILFYRPDVLAEAGYDEPPKTYAELEEVAAAIADLPDFAGIGMRARQGEGMNVIIWASFLHGYGGSFVDENGYPVLNSPEAVKATQKYADLINNYGPTGGQDFTHYELYTGFSQGTLGMYLDAASLAGIFGNPEKSAVVGKWDAAPWPSGPEAGSTFAYSHGLMIAKNSENKEAAWQFLQWYTGKELELKISTLEEGAFIGVCRNSVIETAEYQDRWSGNNILNAIEGSLAITHPDYRLTNNPDWPWIGDTIGVAIQDVIIGADAQETMDALNVKLTDFMVRRGYVE